MNYHLSNFNGSSALAAFRTQQLLTKIQQIVPQVQQLHAHYVHWVATEEVLDATMCKTLECLLQYGNAAQIDGNAPVHLVVMPRLGTVSPWASKATDIARNCGLSIHRIERVVHYAAPPFLRARWMKRVCGQSLLYCMTV
ncbi:MAG: hypothetical protein ACRCWR_07575 [Saezia sp.]